MKSNFKIVYWYKIFIGKVPFSTTNCKQLCFKTVRDLKKSLGRTDIKIILKSNRRYTK